MGDTMKDDLRIQKGLETKDRIRAAAISILAREGMSGLSAKKIADEAGISKSTIFHHFHAVDDILVDLFEVITSEATRSLSSFNYESLEEFFRALGKLTIELAEKNRETFIALFHYFNYALIHPDYKHRIHNLKQQLIKVYSNCIQAIEPTKPAVLINIAESIVITLDAFGMHYSLDGDKEKFLNQWKIQSDMYCRYLRSE